MKKNIYISVLLVVCFLASSFSSKFKPVFGVKVIVIDAGHGGKDPGAHGGNHNEKDIALAVALKLGKYIEENLKDVKVVYTRSTDVFVELQERAEIANRAKADLFISIHCNSACVRGKPRQPDICREQVNGAETYVMGIKNEKGKLDIAKRENSAILLEDNYVKKYDGFDPNSDESYIIMSMFADTYLTQSLNFASKAQKQYCKQAARCDKGVKRASLWVLWRTYMPSVLTEIGYLSNADEVKYLASEKGQSNIAFGLFRAFREYKDEIEGTVKKYDDSLEKQQSNKESVEDSVIVENSKNVIKKVNTDSSAAKVVKEIKTEPKVEKVEEKNKSNPPKKEPEKKSVTLAEKFANELKKNEAKAKEEKKPVVIYKVLFLSSEKKLALNSDKFKNIEKPGEYIDKGVYKYTSGEFTNQKEAKDLQTKLRNKGYKDAFVIAMQDGKRIALK